MDSDSLNGFTVLLRGWRAYLAGPDGEGTPRHDGFVRAVRTCADQLEEVIDRARALELEDDGGEPPAEWHCMGCGADFYGTTAGHVCPVPVVPLRGGIGIYGLDWTYG